MRLAWWRREDPEEIERLRRLDVNRRGRITVGQIVDLLEPEPPGRSSRLIVYKYQVAGVTYEVSQDVSGLPRVAPHAPEVLGQEASVKYDLQTPTNSIVACEEWCGLKSRDENQKSETSNQKAPESRA
jgi:hypothetical protein